MGERTPLTGHPPTGHPPTRHPQPTPGAAPAGPECAPSVRAGGLARTVAGGLPRTARPRHWVKNPLVVTVPTVTRQPTAPGMVRQLALFSVLFSVLFTVAASTVHLLNDVCAAQADSAYPDTRRRPVTAGVLPVPLACTPGGALALASTGAAARPHDRPLAGIGASWEPLYGPSVAGL